MKTTKEQIEVMQAFEDRREIEWLDLNCVDLWHPVAEPSWNWGKIDYRIKKTERELHIEKMIEAESRGEVVQYKSKLSGEWKINELYIPRANDGYEYRIKPEEPREYTLCDIKIDGQAVDLINCSINMTIDELLKSDLIAGEDLECGDLVTVNSCNKVYKAKSEPKITIGSLWEDKDTKKLCVLKKEGYEVKIRYIETGVYKKVWFKCFLDKFDFIREEI